GDYEDVVGAGALEVCLDIPAKEGAPADQRRLHQRTALARPELGNVGQSASANTASPQADAAPQEAGENFYVGGMRGAGQPDTLLSEVTDQVQRASIAVISWQA